MGRALNALRNGPHYRREAFAQGLKASGYTVHDSFHDPRPGDALLIWNRYGHFAEMAIRFESVGATVIVAENSPLPMPGHWYSVALSHVAMTGGAVPDRGPQRWDSWGQKLAPWRTGGSEIVILAQRQIGHPSVASPPNWAERVRERIGGRIRQHPGMNSAVPLADDLRNASAVVTWSSAAAIQALAMGIPVWHAHPAFIGAAASRPLAEFGVEPRRDNAARLAVFRRLAWAVWSLDEIAAGKPFG